MWIVLLACDIDAQEVERVYAQEAQSDGRHLALTREQVAQFMNLALAGIEREYPNKPSNVLTSAADVVSPRELHPVFYGCFDWHSSVHGHWLLVRLLKLYPQHEKALEVRQLLDRQLSAEKLLQELAYFNVKENESFERMYGWAWLLRLVIELRTWQDSDAQRWSANLQPLELRIVELVKAYLPRLTYPIRTGEHPDTGFALAQIYDYAITIHDPDLQSSIRDFCVNKYLNDSDYPARYEPSGQDFFSTCLNEADLMRRTLNATDFARWLETFLPQLGIPNGSAQSLLSPVSVSDVTDGKLVHLAGLNFNRAWTQYGVAFALPQTDPRREVLLASARAHEKSGLEYVFSGHYEGEHWLATFAVYAMTDAGY